MLVLAGSSRQSVERAPLVTEEKAKLAALGIHRTVLGRSTLTLPNKVVYCSHSWNACSKHSHCQFECTLAFSRAMYRRDAAANAVERLMKRSMIWLWMKPPLATLPHATCGPGCNTRAGQGGAGRGGAGRGRAREGRTGQGRAGQHTFRSSEGCTV